MIFLPLHHARNNKPAWDWTYKNVKRTEVKPQRQWANFLSFSKPACMRIYSRLSLPFWNRPGVIRGGCICWLLDCKKPTCGFEGVPGNVLVEVLPRLRPRKAQVLPPHLRRIKVYTHFRLEVKSNFYFQIFPDLDKQKDLLIQRPHLRLKVLNWTPSSGTYP